MSENLVSKIETILLGSQYVNQPLITGHLINVTFDILATDGLRL